MAFEDFWNKTFKEQAGDKPVFDDWLDKYLNILKKASTPILDLGCGKGNNALYLTEKGFNVVACDYSKEAIKSLKKFVPKAKTKLVDISKKLPFNNQEFEIIIADLSLHYFDSKTTMQIMKEIKRILKKGGHIFARVNSLNDTNHGAGQGVKLEENYYFVDGYNKRFFSVDEACKYFSIIGEVKAFEAEMFRLKKPKNLIEICVEK